MNELASGVVPSAPEQELLDGYNDELRQYREQARCRYESAVHSPHQQPSSPATLPQHWEETSGVGPSPSHNEGLPDSTFWQGENGPLDLPPLPPESTLPVPEPLYPDLSNQQFSTR